MAADSRFARYLLSEPVPAQSYSPSGGSDIVRMLMEQGRAQADATRAQGDIWSGALQQAGQQLAGGFQQAAEEKKLKKRDAAWLGVVNDPELMKDPRKAYAKSVEIFGEADAGKHFQSLVAMHQMAQPKRDQAADTKALVAFNKGFKALDPATRAASWGTVRPLITSAFGTELPEQYDDNQYTKMWAPAIEGLEKPEKAPEGFTLSPGQQRFGADGKPIASAPPVPKETKFQTIETAQGIQTFDPTTGQVGPVVARSKPNAPREPREDPPVAVMGPDGNAVFVPRSQAYGKRPASNREQGRPVTAGSATTIASMNTALSELDKLESTVTPNATGMSAQVGAALPNFVTEMTGIGADAKAKQAVIDRVKQTFGKTLEGGVLRKEDEEKYKRILPAIGDPPEVVAAKIRGLRAQMETNRQNLIESLGDAGYDTGAYQARGSGGSPRSAAPSAPQGAPARPRATNPQTGAVVEWDGKAWVPVK